MASLAGRHFSVYVWAMQPWVTSPSFSVDANNPWQTNPTPVVKHDWQSDENLKKQFGIELAKAANAFEAACTVSGEDTTKALWISWNWAADPLVIASRDLYLKTVQANSPPLDREQLAAKVLALADEKILSVKHGCLIPVAEAKDRIAALKLYSDILGYTGKVEVDNSTKTFVNNELTLKFVKASDKAVPVTIDQASNIKSENVNVVSPPITLKLVGGASR